ncbi:MAG: amino acid ABC transporter permease [Clostridia bacterium]|nr:amino acid ABC transporter permease [Clostridia bacterium]MDY3784373.1 amino acid ABC transporter permease [Eubacteriales bacterium]
MTFLDVTLYLLDGFKITFFLFLLTLIFSLPLGLLISFCSMSRFRPLKAITKVFVWIIRGVPLMLQIFIIYYVPGFIGFNIFAPVDIYFVLNFGIEDMGRFLAALIAFSINYACYFSEIFRGGIESISRGQYEAGQVLGLTKKQIFKKIVLVQVIKRIVPPMSNEIITLVKDTALANAILVSEIIMQANKLAAKAMIWPLFYAGVFYLVFVGVLTVLLGKLEKRLSYFKS